MIGFFMLRRRQPLSREQSLASMPLHNEAIGAERTDSGDARLTVPRRENWWVRVLDRVLYVPKNRRIRLDELGTYVWDLCDGHHTVRDVIRAMSARYKLHRKEAEVSVVTYLRQLARKGLIGIAVPKTREEAARLLKIRLETRAHE
jgi:hypothetical protein